MSKQNLK